MTCHSFSPVRRFHSDLALFCMDFFSGGGGTSLVWSPHPLKGKPWHLGTKSEWWKLMPAYQTNRCDAYKCWLVLVRLLLVQTDELEFSDKCIYMSDSFLLKDFRLVSNGTRKHKQKLSTYFVL